MEDPEDGGEQEEQEQLSLSVSVALSHAAGRGVKPWGLGVREPIRHGNTRGPWKGEGEQEGNNPKQNPFYTLYFKTDFRVCLSCSQKMIFIFIFILFLFLFLFFERRLFNSAYFCPPEYAVAGEAPCLTGVWGRAGAGGCSLC